MKATEGGNDINYEKNDIKEGSKFEVFVWSGKSTNLLQIITGVGLELASSAIHECESGPIWNRYPQLMYVAPLDVKATMMSVFVFTMTQHSSSALQCIDIFELRRGANNDAVDDVITII